MAKVIVPPVGAAVVEVGTSQRIEGTGTRSVQETVHAPLGDGRLRMDRADPVLVPRIQVQEEDRGVGMSEVGLGKGFELDLVLAFDSGVVSLDERKIGYVDVRRMA
jgi:hypothetical protein